MLSLLLPRTSPAPQKPLRDELLSIERLEERAKALAARFTLDPNPRRVARNVFPRFDDNARVLRAACEFLLTRQDAIVTGAASGAEGFAAVKRHPPDVLLSDIEMPDESGYSLIGRVRALPSDQGGSVPAVAMTAHGSREDNERALAAGFQRHLPKPFQPADLFALIGDLAGRSSVAATS